MSVILIVDDDPLIRETLAALVAKLGHQALLAPDLAQAQALAAECPLDLVLLDVQLPDGSGLESLPALKWSPSEPEIIILTGHGDPDGAELAINNGAWDYLEKPASTQEIKLTLQQALEFRRQRRAGRSLPALDRRDLVGSSPAMRACLEVTAQAAASLANVLITGETGTGKELVAWVIHDNGPRRAHPFVVVDCGCLPENLVESLLFGHERGAFTGANLPQEGLLGQADGGTLFLDEVGELPPSVQKSFLRCLQEKRFRPLGSRREQQSDFRLIAATNRDLERMVAEGTFRQDLMFRLKSLVIELPPLRERLDDLGELAAHHLERICQRAGLPPKCLAPGVLETLGRYHWPGNVRELVNVLESAVGAAAGQEEISVFHLPAYFRAKLARRAVGGKSAGASPGVSAPPPPQAGLAAAPAAPTPPSRQEAADPADPGGLPSLKDFKESLANQAERQYLYSLVRYSGGDIHSACQMAGVSRGHLYALLKKHNLTLFKQVSLQDLSAEDA
ncbi:MAG: sigma-54-dependent Fis family transcriptional regulator [Desulfarculus sp.]|nr:sigma-54-dependent Fis family transcriptional regulator [Desulfarculus sp.]